ncbi:hypothetical protein TTHERM_00429950 (macronuclear) [Tetrahymena thermophila SB210]|uniref:Uncharacterized protein n=1 Tax=Tetrahymena thermophila (strain SB210) TaxID=312017 RepID=Q231G5_TETTS|nr:hypothetical protein TTHERM_00429950 [Tetrahymena thermophila SB210]EAR91074.1 hypothetical protein TTHERM_00429950 [Tetrahymena thermophila SB210]|eukprot:XP_001011319.1 hypothetical protein TTHERM_00429950 [Tetrahymena thermophila SB210]
MSDILFLSDKFQFGRQKEQIKQQSAADKSIKIQLDLTLSTDRIKNMNTAENQQFSTPTHQYYFEKLSPIMRKKNKIIDAKSNPLLQLSDEDLTSQRNKFGAMKLEKIDFSQMMSQKYQKLMEKQASKTTREYEHEFQNKIYQFPEQNYSSNQNRGKLYINQDFTQGKGYPRKKSKQLSDIVIKSHTEESHSYSDAFLKNNLYMHSVNNQKQDGVMAQISNLNSEYTSQFWKVKQNAIFKNISQNNNQQSQNSPLNNNKYNKHHQSINSEMNLYSQHTCRYPQKYNLKEINLKIPQKQNLDQQIDSDNTSPASPVKFHKLFQSSPDDVKKDFGLKTVTQNQIYRSNKNTSQNQINSFSSLIYDLQPLSLTKLSSSHALNQQLKELKGNKSLNKVKSSPFLMTFSSKQSSSPTTKTSSPSKQLSTANNFTSSIQLESKIDQVSPCNINNSNQKCIFRLSLSKSSSEQQPLTFKKENQISNINKNLKQFDNLGVVGSFLNIQKVQVDDNELKNPTNAKLNKLIINSFNNNNVNNYNGNSNNNNNGQLLTPSTQTASFFQKSPILSCTSEVQQQFTPITKIQRPSLILQKIESLASLDSPQLSSLPIKQQQSIIIEEELNLIADFSIPQSPIIKAERNRERKASIMKDSVEREMKKRSSICKESLSPVYRRNYSKLKSMTDESLVLDSISLTSSPLTLNSKIKAREASYVLESKIEEIKQHLLTQFLKEQELSQIVEEFCMIKSHEFINEIVRFLKYSIECYNKKKLIENQADMYQSNLSQNEKQQSNINHNTDTCGHHHHHHLLMINEQNNDVQTMKFQIIPKILLDWVIHELFQLMKSWKIDGDNLFAYLVELAITHLLPHNLYEELGSEKGIKNWIKIILEKLQQIVVLETSKLNEKFEELYQIVVNIIHNNFSNVSHIFQIFSIDFNFTSIEFYLLKKVFIESFSFSRSKFIHAKSVKGNQTTCQLIDFYNNNASKEVVVQQDGYVNSYIKNEILTRIEICRNILLNVIQPYKEDKVISQISIFLNSIPGFNKQNKQNGQTLKTVELFVKELIQVFYQNKEKREAFLLLQKNKFVENYDKKFWQHINLAFEKIMENKLEEDLDNQYLQIDINLQLYLLEIESYQLENQEYQSIYDYIQNIQQLITDLFLYIENLYFNLGEDFPVDIIQSQDKTFMHFFLETALSPGSYSSTDIYQAFLYQKINRELFNFWMKCLQKVLEQDKYQLNQIQQRDLLTFLYNIVPS